MQENAPTESSIFGLLTPQQLASQLNVTGRTLQRWELSRIGPPRVVIGRQIFYRVSSVEKWLEEREIRRTAKR